MRPRRQKHRAGIAGNADVLVLRSLAMLSVIGTILAIVAGVTTCTKQILIGAMEILPVLGQAIAEGLLLSLLITGVVVTLKLLLGI